MNKQLNIFSSSPEETRRLGEGIGASTQKSVAIALVGKLGAGKTCLVQGIAEGLERAAMRQKH